MSINQSTTDKNRLSQCLTNNYEPSGLGYLLDSVVLGIGVYAGLGAIIKSTSQIGKRYKTVEKAKNFTLFRQPHTVIGQGSSATVKIPRSEFVIDTFRLKSGKNLVITDGGKKSYFNIYKYRVTPNRVQLAISLVAPALPFIVRECKKDAYNLVNFFTGGKNEIYKLDKFGASSKYNKSMASFPEKLFKEYNMDTLLLPDRFQDASKECKHNQMDQIILQKSAFSSCLFEMVTSVMPGFTSLAPVAVLLTSEMMQEYDSTPSRSSRGN